MTAKIIYFTVNGKLERAEFGAHCSAADVKDLFHAAAEAGPRHILKMYDMSGSVLNISPQLEANSEHSHYRLEVVASDLQSVAVLPELDGMEHRLHRLESKVTEDVAKTPEVICELKSQVETFKRKLESVEHLSWMGLFKDDQHISTFSSTAPRLSVQEERQQVRNKFLNLSSLQVTEDVREHLKTPIFDNWQWEEAEMLVLLQVMYTDLDFLTAFHIQLDDLQNFLFEVYCHYNSIPFHNFQHCFCVTQMVYKTLVNIFPHSKFKGAGLLYLHVLKEVYQVRSSFAPMYGLVWLTDLRNKLESIDLLIMLTSALCHDLDHPGYNNVYQINAQTDLALRYNDMSPLENHHCAVAFGILSKPECNIFKNLTSQQYKHVRGGMIKCILATDMARHNEILNKFKVMQPLFDFSNEDHKEVLMKIMVKVSDISNEARPMAVAEPWLDCLLQEFFNQSDTEKLKGLPVTPFMDRDKVSKPSSQTSFIRFVLLPLFTELTKLFPCLEEHILEPVQRALQYYSEMERATKEEEEEGGRERQTMKSRWRRPD